MAHQERSDCHPQGPFGKWKITPVIDSTFRLSETREAFRHMMQDEIQGRVIITAAEGLV